ncbi:MAG: pentapeptide repeat-containing protein [Thermodesulfobacteriota bacterium]
MWKGQKPSEEDLKQILAEIKEAHLWSHNLSGANLSGADLSGADLNMTLLLNANLSAASLRGADLSGAFMSGANLSSADVSEARLSGALLDGADLSRAKLIDADLDHADLRKANLHWADLSGARLLGAKLCGASTIRADLSKAQLFEADLSGADLRHANLSDADVNGVKYNRKTKFLGARLATCYGSPKFVSFARHQEYLEEMRQGIGGWIAFALWWLFADCGRTIWRWILWSLIFAVGFACVFYYLNLNPAAPAFKIHHGLPNDFHTMLYYSVVTFTTLGFGDITPLTREAAYWVMAEVILGYVMLGGLISIFATKLARRF